MAFSADLTRTVVLKARRDTILLVAAVTGVTFALSSAIHSRPAAPGAPPQQHWTGGLADVAPADIVPASDEPLTSASLVVPVSALTLPQVPMRALVKLRGCDGGLCTARTTQQASIRRAAEVATLRHAVHKPKPTLMSQLNPLNHLPDMSKISRPFAVAGDTVSGWLRGL